MRLLVAWIALIALACVLEGGGSWAAEPCALTLDAPSGPLEIRAEPAAGAKVLAAIEPGSVAELRRLDARATPGGDWLTVAHGAVSGWANAAFIACPLSAEETKEAVGPLAMRVLQAMRLHDMRTLATAVHPVKGVRFAPYDFLDEAADRHLTAGEIRRAWGSRKVRMWGAYDGSGDPIRLTFAGYFREVRLRPRLRGSGRAELRHRAAGNGGGTRQFAEESPNAVIAEAHVPGTDPALGGMDWRTLRLLFEEHDGAWYSCLCHPRSVDHLSTKFGGKDAAISRPQPAPDRRGDRQGDRDDLPGRATSGFGLRDHECGGYREPEHRRVGGWRLRSDRRPPLRFG